MSFNKNSVNCDIYVGIGAGKKLLEDIRTAKSSIRIISPYVSNSTVNLLRKLSNKIDVALITSHTDGVATPGLKRAINQNKVGSIIGTISKAAVQILGCLMLLTSIALAILTIKDYGILIGDTYYICSLVSFLAAIWMVLKARKLKNYSYSYSPIFPLKVLSYDTGFMHSKIYIVDERVAYMGSFNFTQKGLTKNYETQLRITDELVVHDLCAEYDMTFESLDKYCMPIQEIGKKVYWDDDYNY